MLHLAPNSPDLEGCHVSTYLAENMHLVHVKEHAWSRNTQKEVKVVIIWRLQPGTFAPRWTGAFMVWSPRSIKWNQSTPSVVNWGCYFHVAHTDSFLFWHLWRQGWSNWLREKQATRPSHDPQAAGHGVSEEDMLDRQDPAEATNSSAAILSIWVRQLMVRNPRVTLGNFWGWFIKPLLDKQVFRLFFWCSQK